MMLPCDEMMQSVRSAVVKPSDAFGSGQRTGKSHVVEGSGAQAAALGDEARDLIVEPVERDVRERARAPREFLLAAWLEDLQPALHELDPRLPEPDEAADLRVRRRCRRTSAVGLTPRQARPSSRPSQSSPAVAMPLPQPSGCSSSRSRRRRRCCRPRILRRGPECRCCRGSAPGRTCSRPRRSHTPAWPTDTRPSRPAGRSGWRRWCSRNRPSALARAAPVGAHLTVRALPVALRAVTPGAPQSCHRRPIGEDDAGDTAHAAPASVRKLHAYS